MFFGRVQEAMTGHAILISVAPSANLEQSGMKQALTTRRSRKLGATWQMLELKIFYQE